MNVIPMATLSRLRVDASHMRKTHLVVRAFDKTRKEVIENMELPIQIGPCTFNIDFQVMDINPSYNYLLGRPWVHMVEAVPSALLPIWSRQCLLHYFPKGQIRSGGTTCQRGD